MAAGLGFKTFTTGEVLTANDTNGYLMQGVLVFASSAARASAITSPQEGQYSYLKDTNSTEYYDGAAWIAAPIGDITGVTAGTGISGGGTSGTVTVSIDTSVTVDKTTAQTLTNKTLTSPALTTPTISTATTNGDLLYGTGSGVLTRLGIGSAAQVLTVASGVPSWATPSAGGTTFSGAAVKNSPTTQTLSNATWTTLTYNLEFFDTDAYHDNTTNTSRFTIPTGKTGYYEINAMAVFENAAPASTSRQIRLLKNGTSIQSTGDNTSVYSTMYPQASFGAVYYLAAADYVELQAIQNTGGNLYVFKDGVNSYFQITYLGA
jgi:hypothetical protein